MTVMPSPPPLNKLLPSPLKISALGSYLGKDKEILGAPLPLSECILTNWWFEGNLLFLLSSAIMKPWWNPNIKENFPIKILSKMIFIYKNGLFHIW